MVPLLSAVLIQGFLLLLLLLAASIMIKMISAATTIIILIKVEAGSPTEAGAAGSAADLQALLVGSSSSSVAGGGTYLLAQDQPGVIDLLIMQLIQVMLMMMGLLRLIGCLIRLIRQLQQNKPPNLGAAVAGSSSSSSASLIAQIITKIVLNQERGSGLVVIKIRLLLLPEVVQGWHQVEDSDQIWSISVPGAAAEADQQHLAAHWRLITDDQMQDQGLLLLVRGAGV